VNPTSTTIESHAAQVERIARELVPRASQLTRLVLRQTSGQITRSEGGMLRALSDGDRRVTELAELEGLAQPTTTILIKRLESHRWVQRRRDAADGRAVLVSLTPAGEQALEEYRSQYRSLLRDHLALMTDEQVAALGDAVDALDALVVAIQQGETR
jgi:DNA-binding MarR family transcriptional regulator